MDYRELTATQYNALVGDLVKITESLHVESQDVGDGHATIGDGYTFNRGNNVQLWRASGFDLTATSAGVATIVPSSTHRCDVTLISARSDTALGWVAKVGLATLVATLAGCQQAKSTSMTALPSQEHAVSAVNAAQAAPPVSVPASEKWKLSVSPGEAGTYRIHVAGVDGREIQVIDGQEGTPPYAAAALVKLEDFTGDGNPDILARGLSAGASALTSEALYVYDARAGRFLAAELFENDGEVTKTRQGCIAVEHRNPGNTTYSKDHYCC